MTYSRKLELYITLIALPLGLESLLKERERRDIFGIIENMLP